MARQNHGPLSRAKGKIGGVVYQQYEGMQISREYQPVVKNPQSTKQVTNRAKFKLASQTLAQFKEVFSTRLSKLSIYERMRRAAAVNAIYNVVDDGDPQSMAALVSAITGAINEKSMSTMSAPEFTLSTNNLSITAEAGSDVFYIICEYDANKGELVSRTFTSYESQGDPYQVTTKNSNRKIIFAVGTMAFTDEGRATISNIRASSDSIINEIARAAAAGDIEISNMAGYVLPPAA